MSLFQPKSKTLPQEIFAALDIGSSKVCCAIAKISKDTKADKHFSFKTVGVASHLSKGIRGASIINLEDLEYSILNAVHAAEQLAKQTINSLYVNIPADALQSCYITSKISLYGQAVKTSHLEKAIDIGRDSNIGAGRQVLHVFPMWYDLDESTQIQEPKGMIGNTLTTHLHVITAPTHLIANLSACIGRCHLDVNTFVAGPYATALATLADDEKEMGVTLLDVGGHSVSIISFLRGMPVFFTSIPIGGNHITHDIAQGLNTSLSQAERLKTLYGSLIGSVDDQETILVTQLGEDHLTFANPVSKSFLMHIIKSRAEEIIETIDKTLRRQAMDPIVLQRFVITGGASQLQGLRELMQQYFNKSVRLAVPQNIQGIGDMVHTPTFSLCAGLLHYAMRDYYGLQLYHALEKPKGFLKRVWNSIRQRI